VRKLLVTVAVVATEVLKFFIILALMKNLLFLISLLFLFSSAGQKAQTDEQLIRAFVTEWIDTSGSEGCALKYLNIHESYLQGENKKFLFEWFSLIGKFYKEEIHKNSGKYQILAHEANPENDSIKRFNLKTDSYSGVYYLIVGGKIVAPIIVKEGKIISFSTVWIHVNVNEFNKPWFINRASLE
jgi:hypothetical protein